MFHEDYMENLEYPSSEERAENIRAAVILAAIFALAVTVAVKVVSNDADEGARLSDDELGATEEVFIDSKKNIPIF